MIPMTIEETIRKGRAASELLKSEIFNTVMADLKVKAFETWHSTATAEVEAREDCYFLMLAIAHLRDQLDVMAQNATLEQTRLDESEMRKKNSTTPRSKA